MPTTRLKFLPPRRGHCESGACVCSACGTNMRVVGIEPHPHHKLAADLFTYECICGELHTDLVHLGPIALGGTRVDIKVTSRH